jgi:hypothetical protein
MLQNNNQILKSQYIKFNVNDISKNAIEIVQNNLATKEYKLIAINCFCGIQIDDAIITDSFYPNFIGSEIKIVICKNCGTIRCNPYLQYQLNLISYFRILIYFLQNE